MAGGAQCTEASVSCRGLGFSDIVVEGSQAGESQAGSLQALAYAAGELHAQEHLQQVASVAPSGSARPRHAAAPLPGVYEGHDVDIEDSAFEGYGAKQLQRDMQSQSQSGGDEEGQQGDELAGQGGESGQAEGQGEHAADRKRASHLPNTPEFCLPLASCHFPHALGHAPGQGKPRVGHMGYPPLTPR